MSTQTAKESREPSSGPDEKAIADAYTYLLSRLLVIRQEHMDRKGEGFAYNAIKYNPLGSADFVNPNFDVAYFEAWIAVDANTPALLEVPEVTGRYYTAQILDEWGEVIVNINERTFPSKPYGTFALVAPDSATKTPDDAGRVVLHSNKAKMLGRVELKDDSDGAVKLQKAFRLSSLGKPEIKSPPEIPMFDNQDLIGVEIFDDLDIRLATLDVAPNAAEMQQKARSVAAYIASRTDARTKVDTLLREKLVKEFQVFATTKAAPYRNHWLGGGRAGNYGTDYPLRTMVNYMGIWGNTGDEAVYFGAMRDSDEQPLDGSKSYVIHFPADGLPQSVVNAYWSVILVSVPDYRVVNNPLKRYNFNNQSPLQKESDGSLKIAVGPKPVAGVPEANWLPSSEGKPFMLTFRTYVPKEIVARGWTPPALQRQ
jgi:hypothetical protein